MATALRGPLLLRATGGAAMVEYVIVLTLVAMIGGLAITSLGPEMVRSFRYAQLMIACPI